MTYLESLTWKTIFFIALIRAHGDVVICVDSKHTLESVQRICKIPNVCWHKSSPETFTTAANILSAEKVNFKTGTRRSLTFVKTASPTDFLQRKKTAVNFAGTTIVHLAYQFHIPHFMETLALMSPLYIKSRKPFHNLYRKPTRSVFLQQEAWTGDMSYQKGMISIMGALPAVFANLNDWNLALPKIMNEFSNISSLFHENDTICFDNIIIGHGHWFFEPVYSYHFRSRVQQVMNTGYMHDKSEKHACIVTRQFSRVIINTNAIFHVCKRHYRTVNVFSYESLSFSDQQKQTSMCKVVVTVHGAGMTNILFMPVNATVIEIFPYAYTPGYYYRSLAYSVSVNIIQLFSDSSSAQNDCVAKYDSYNCSTNVSCIWCFKVSNFTVDISKFMKAWNTIHGLKSR